MSTAKTIQLKTFFVATVVKDSFGYHLETRKVNAKSFDEATGIAVKMILKAQSNRYILGLETVEIKS